MKLQIAIIVLVVVAAVLALLVFSGAVPGLPGSGPRFPIVMWGTLPERSLAETISKIKQVHQNVSLSYVEKSPDALETEFLNALARREGPDIVIIPPELAFKQRDKFLNLAGSSLSERTFRDTFVDGADMLLAGGEIRAVPFLIDPLMLYWNRDLLRNESLSEPPKTWDEFLTHTARLTKIDKAGNILASGAALGLETNVRNFKEVLSMLILQAGNPIVDPATFRVVISRESPFSKTPAENALRFYTEFARPSKASYSWSQAQPNSREAFSRGILALYFGFASEFPSLRSQNPHLNFDLAPPPQIRGGKLNLTYGRIYSLGVPQNSKYARAAVQTMFYLLENDAVGLLAEKLALAPSKRALLALPPKNPIAEAVWQEAVRAKSWPDRDHKKTSEIFSAMIRSVYSGAKSTNNAVRDAEAQLQAIYQE